MSVFPDLQIVIVNWNLKEDTLACVDSILTAGIDLEQIILVDNASIDGSAAAVQERFGPQIKIIKNETNLGFSGGNNIGIQSALEGLSSWIFLLNNDTIVDPAMFKELCSGVQEAQNYGIFAPLIFYYDAPEIIWSAGDQLIKGTLATKNLYHRKRKPADLPTLLDVDFVTGSGMLVRRSVVENIGLLDTSLFMYAEEVDFIWRARLAGYKVGCIPNAHLLHKVSLSANRDRPKARYLRIRNQIVFYRKYTSGLKLTIMFMIVLLRSAIMVMKDIGLRQTELILPLVRGWRDGWFSKITSNSIHINNTR